MRRSRARLSVGFLLIGLSIATSGCVGGVKLRHPATGQQVECGPYAIKFGLGYMELDRCLDDYQRQGFQRAP